MVNLLTPVPLYTMCSTQTEICLKWFLHLGFNLRYIAHHVLRSTSMNVFIWHKRLLFNNYKTFTKINLKYKKKTARFCRKLYFLAKGFPDKND